MTRIEAIDSQVKAVLTAEEALRVARKDLFTGPLHMPGGPPIQIASDMEAEEYRRLCEAITEADAHRVRQRQWLDGMLGLVHWHPTGPGSHMTCFFPGHGGSCRSHPGVVALFYSAVPMGPCPQCWGDGNAMNVCETCAQTGMVCR